MVEHKFSIIFVTVGTTKFNALIDSLLTNDFISVGDIFLIDFFQF